MKIANTINTFRCFTSTPSEAVQAHEGTGFKYLDYSFYRVITNANDPIMGDNWKDAVLAVKDTADRLGFTFVQAHGPYCTVAGEDMERNLLGAGRSVAA
ncbi:MAG: hypothetical protein IJ325_11465 [Clostridia bacterium]|nr:hypothetical protein [Clostridia bacterium]